MEEDLVTAFLKEVATFVGIEEIKFDAEGMCTLEFQNEFLFVLRIDRELERLVIIAEINTAPKNPLSFFTEALSFNTLRIGAPGAWIARDKNTGILFLADEFFISTINLATFQEGLAQFFEQYLSCQGFLNEEIINTELEEESPSPLVEPNQMA